MSERGPEYVQGTNKRKLDVLAGTAIACALLPIGAAVAPIVAINTRSPKVLFRQERIGKNGEPFDIVKFRTIPINRQDEHSVPLGSYDRRASRVGMAMRDLGIDEVPQIYNVLNGEMSMVGPRPLLNLDIERLRSIEPILFDEWYDFYSSTKPGLAGPSQFMRHEYRVTEDFAWKEGMRLDLDYGEKASLMTDTRIILSSPFRMVLARLRMTDNSDAAAGVAEQLEEIIQEEVA